MGHHSCVGHCLTYAQSTVTLMCIILTGYIMIHLCWLRLRTGEDFISTHLSCSSPPDHLEDSKGYIAADLRLESLDCWSSLLQPGSACCCCWEAPTIEGLRDRWSGLCDPAPRDVPRPPPLRPPLFRSASMMPLAGAAELIA